MKVHTVKNVVCATILNSTVPAASVADGLFDLIIQDGDITPNGVDRYQFDPGNPPAVTLGNTGAVFASDLINSFDEVSFFVSPSSGGELLRDGTLVASGTRVVDGLDFILPSAINDSGTVLVAASIDTPINPNVNNRGLFLIDSTSTTAVAIDGQFSPDGVARLNGITGFTAEINNAGQVAFAVDMFGTDVTDNNDDAIFRFDGADQPLVKIVRDGDPAPNGFGVLVKSGIPSNPFDVPVMNAAGQVAFFADIDGGINGADSGIFRGDGTSITKIVRYDDAVPVADSRSGFYRLRSKSGNTINDAGEVVFQGTFRHPISSSREGLFLGDGNGLEAIALEGQEFEGGTFIYSTFSRQVAFNNAGQVFFTANTRTDNSFGTPETLLVYEDGQINIIAKQNEAAPGPSGGTFDTFATGDGFAANDAGQLAFMALVDDTGGFNKEALYFYDDNLGIIEIAREGDIFLGSEIRELEFLGNVSSSNTGINDFGQVAYSFELEDGNAGVVIWNSIPEPTALLLFTMLLPLMLSRRYSPLRNKITLGEENGLVQ